MAEREKREAAFHLGWAAIVIAFSVALALATSRPALSVVFGLAALGSIVSWAAMSGWRLRGPFWRVPLPIEPTIADLERKEAARKVRDALIQLLHASARPAAAKLLEIIETMAEDLRSRPEPANTLGMFVDLYTVLEAKQDEANIRETLEGNIWDLVQGEQNEALRRFIAQSVLESNTAQSLGTAFFDYYRQYKLHVATAKRLASLVGVDASVDHLFVDWRQLDERFTFRLREVVALPELANQRDDFEEWIGKWSTS